MNTPQIEASIDADSPTEAVASAATEKSKEEEGGQEGGEAGAGAVGPVATENLEDDVMEAAEQPEVPRTPVERLRVELHGLLEGIVEQAFDGIRGSHLRRKQLRQLIDRAETPQASLDPKFKTLDTVRKFTTTAMILTFHPPPPLPFSPSPLFVVIYKFLHSFQTACTLVTPPMQGSPPDSDSDSDLHSESVPHSHPDTSSHS